MPPKTKTTTTSTPARNRPAGGRASPTLGWRKRARSVFRTTRYGSGNGSTGGRIIFPPARIIRWASGVGCVALVRLDHDHPHYLGVGNSSESWDNFFKNGRSKLARREFVFNNTSWASGGSGVRGVTSLRRVTPIQASTLCRAGTSEFVFDRRWSSFAGVVSLPAIAGVVRSSESAT